MEPEEKAKIKAETDKFKAEAENIRKSGWRKPSSWIPILAAIVAIATSIGQCQVASLKDREASLVAREKGLKAKEEEQGLMTKNAELAMIAQGLSAEIKNSTKEIKMLEEKYRQVNDQLLKVVKDSNDETTIAKIKAESKERNKQVADIVRSAEQRDEAIKLGDLVRQMNSSFKAERLSAVEELIQSYKSDPLAISMALDLLYPPQLETLSASGRINVLVFLRNTDVSSWDEKLILHAREALKLIRQRGTDGKAIIGPQTDEALRRLREHIDSFH